MSKLILTEKDFTHQEWNELYSLTPEQAKAINEKLKSVTEVEINFVRKGKPSYNAAKGPSFAPNFWSLLDLDNKKLVINANNFSQFTFADTTPNQSWSYSVDIPASEITLNMINSQEDTFFYTDSSLKFSKAHTFNLSCSDYKIEFDNSYGAFNKIRNLNINTVKPVEQNKLNHYSGISVKKLSNDLYISAPNAPRFDQEKEHTDDYTLNLYDSPSTKLLLSLGCKIKISSESKNTKETFGLTTDEYSDFWRWQNKHLNMTPTIAQLFGLEMQNIPIEIPFQVLQDKQCEYLTKLELKSFPVYKEYKIEQERLYLNDLKEKHSKFLEDIKQFNPAQQLYLQALYNLKINQLTVEDKRYRFDIEDYPWYTYIPDCPSYIIKHPSQEFQNIKTLEDIQKYIDNFYEKLNCSVTKEWANDTHASLGRERSTVSAFQSSIQEHLDKLISEKKVNKK